MSDKLHYTAEAVFNLENRMPSNAVLLSHLSQATRYGRENLGNFTISTIVIANVGGKVKYLLGQTQKWLVNLDSFSPIFMSLTWSQKEKKKILQKKHKENKLTTFI